MNKDDKELLLLGICAAAILTVNILTALVGIVFAIPISVLLFGG